MEQPAKYYKLKVLLDFYQKNGVEDAKVLDEIPLESNYLIEKNIFGNRILGKLLKFTIVFLCQTQSFEITFN